MCSASIVGLAIAIAVLSALQFGLASSSPDGYEAAVARAHDAGSSLGKLESAAATGELNARVQVWQDSLVAEFPASEAARGIMGAVVAGAIALGLAAACSRRKDRVML